MAAVMYLASMDHSPSEQLGADDEWHTTVIVISEGDEHWALASEIAGGIGTKDGKLRKWSGHKRDDYTRRFSEELQTRAGAFPVYIRAVSAQAKAIRACFSQYISQLGLSGAVAQLESGGRSLVKFGPFQRRRYGVAGGDEVFFQLVEKQAVPTIHIAHFLLRTHQSLFPLVRAERSEVDWIDWQIMPNKFPGGIKGKMGSLFNAIMSGAAPAKLVAGNIRMMTFNNSSDDLGSALADNIAGLLREKLGRGDLSIAVPRTVWEILG